MKNTFFSLLALMCIVSVTQGQIDVKSIKNKVNKATGGSSGLSNQEVITGLKEALNVGSNNATASASQPDGFYKNEIIKIPFPQEMKDVESKVRAVGMNRQVDEFVMAMNRAAETAAKEAAPIFLEAIKNITINDGMSILKGEDDAATQYLKGNTNEQLYVRFKPIVQSAMAQVNVAQYWNPIASGYNKIPFTKAVNPDLEDYITLKALDGLFFLVAQEELKIRKDPAARVSDILKKVFGSKN
jgi:hypothetical protein